MTAEVIIPMDTATALQRVAAGDVTAWTWLADTQREHLFAIAMRLLGCASLAEDAVQESLLLVRAQAHGFRPRGGDAEREASAWLARLTMCRAFNLLREGARRRRREYAVADAVAAGEPESELDEDEVRSLRLALGELPERDRRAIALVFFDAQPYERVASELGCSVVNARVRVHRALQRVRRRLRRAGVGAMLALLLGERVDAAERDALRAALEASGRPRLRRCLAVSAFALGLAACIAASLLLTRASAPDRHAIDERASLTTNPAPFEQTSNTVIIDDPDLEAWLDLGRRRGYLYSRGTWWPMAFDAFRDLSKARCDSLSGPGSGGGIDFGDTSTGARINVHDDAHGVFRMSRVRQIGPDPYRYPIDSGRSAVCATMVGLVTSPPDDVDDSCWITCPARLLDERRTGEILELVDPQGGRLIATLELVGIDDERQVECRVIEGSPAAISSGDIVRPVTDAVTLEPPRRDG